MVAVAALATRLDAYLSPFGLRLHAFDTGTEEGRALERRRRARLTFVANVGARAATFGAVVIASRIALPQLGPTRFGIWMVISSLLTVLSLLDLGIGNGMVAPVARAAAAADREALRALVSRGMIVMGALGAGVSIVLAAAAAVVPLHWLFRDASGPVLHEARIGLVTLTILYGTSMPLQAAGRIMSGLQRAYIPQLINIFGSVVGVTGLLLTAGMNISISSYILLTFGVSQFSGLVVFLLLRREGLIGRTPADGSRYAFLFTNGGLFLILQIGSMLGWGIDQTLISAIEGSAVVAGYAVVMRMFMLVSQPLLMLNAPLWASYADALSRGDHGYVRRTLRTSLLRTGGMALMGSLVLVLLARPVWLLFTGGHLALPFTLVLSFAVWTELEALGVALAMFLNGAHILVPQVVTVTCFVAIGMPLKLFVLSHWGADYLPLANAAAYLVSHGLGYGLFFRRTLMAAASGKARAG